MEDICRNCKGIDEATVVFKNQRWKYYIRIGCPLGLIEINKNYTKIDIIKILEAKCAKLKIEKDGK